jgi:hypothetical protein
LPREKVRTGDREVGHRTLKCGRTIWTRSEQSIIASGHRAAPRGRSNDSTRPRLGCVADVSCCPLWQSGRPPPQSNRGL